MKRTLVFLLVILAVTACNNAKQTVANPNVQLIKKYFSTFNKHDWTALANFYTDTADFKDPSLGKGIVKQTRQQTTKKYTDLNATFADINDQLVNIYPAGEKNIVVEFVSRGTAPDNTKFELPICTIFTIENGKITKDYTYYDNF